jgi:hypothetical protein
MCTVQPLLVYANCLLFTKLSQSLTENKRSCQKLFISFTFFFFLSLFFKTSKMNSNHDSYDQYADQLLNSVFANVKQTTATAPIVANTSHEDLLLNQLFQNARISSPVPSSPFLNNSSNTNSEWLLLQQLQQQQQLIEKQLSALTASKNTPPSPVFQVPVVESSSELVVEEDIKPKKIARIPVQQPETPTESNNAALVKATAAAALNNNAGNRPALPKKKSFIRRTLSRKNFKDRENIVPTETMAKQQYEHVAVVDKSPSFWRPREERPKGWWKGNGPNSTATQQQYYQYEEVEEDNDDDEQEEEEDSEEEIPTPVPVKKIKKKVVKQVVVPHLQKVPQQKVPSIKKKAARPMAFKTPTVKAKKKKNKVKEASTATAAAKSTPMYVMPQQPKYYQLPMMMAPPMMPSQGGGGYYYMPGQGNMMTMAPSMQQREESTNKAVVTRKKTVLNPREASNDKCSIM